MSVVVLLSAGSHPASAQPVLPRVEAQAIRLVAGLEGVRGVHAGSEARPASDALGRGLDRMTHLVIGADEDPIPYLVAKLARSRPPLIVAGRRSQGGSETGLVPYAVARALDMALVADAIAITPGTSGETLIVEQALPRGARRRVEVRTPVVVTVHLDAPAPLPFAYGRMRRGTILTDAAPARAEVELAPPPACEEKPYRARPKMLKSAAGLSAAERLKAATGATDGAAANVLVRPDPDVAAREILAFLERIGVGPARRA
ncbi:Electron transfer flavoprotein beta subunit [Beijerinckiaceae bacterium RH AL1]|nr:electron transfer flavoprotein subunit beta [Beijerinckiaceae bacterium]VVB49883.1 Electron transfer flavoprotein beta subunit [Beijerinckiaceae bacterium RH CH11]VVB49960.1 Electron transfer flavoprotein beta subunit [Beijerinckiaceae bacterium RH AL8]VVC57125.1 Electron transfer flavoprotein beta subunit [Beijerinckiaceae bacterium RH AL1]